MNSGSSPWAPRYLLIVPVSVMGLADGVRVSPLPDRVTRSVMSAPSPVNCAITCSTGPPGAVWMTTKLITMIASSVGTISNSRRMI